MTSKKEQAEPKPKRAKRVTSDQFTAAEKAQAVLGVWTERVKTSDIMRAMGINYLMLQQWQERAMEGMLQGLESRANLADGAALPPRLRALLQKRQMAAGKERLAARLEKVAEIASPQETPPS